MFFHDYSVREWQNISDIGNIFFAEQLYVLGITRGYVDYFNKKRDKIRIKKSALIKENVKEYSAKRKNLIRNLSLEEYHLHVDLITIYRFSLKQLQNPKEFANENIYFWMGTREKTFDAPELQKFKVFPNLHYNSSDILVPQLIVRRYIESKNWNIVDHCKNLGVELPKF